MSCERAKENNWRHSPRHGLGGANGVNYKVVSWIGGFAKMCVNPSQTDSRHRQKINYKGVVYPDFGDCVQTPQETSAGAAYERAQWNRDQAVSNGQLDGTKASGASRVGWFH